MKNIIYHNDPADPLFGTTTDIDLPDPPVATPELSELQIIHAKLDAIAASLNVDTSAAVATAQAALVSSG